MTLGRGRSTNSAALSVVLILTILVLASLTSARMSAHAATSTVTQTSSGLVASDSLTTGTTAGWAIGGNAPAGDSSSVENSTGLYLGAKSSLGGSWDGWFAKSGNTKAMVFHALLTLPYK